MAFTQTHDIQGTLDECLREMISALGHRDFTVKGDEITVHDGDKTFVISLAYEGDRKLGSLNLPMTHVECVCSGCTEEEAAAFQADLSKHMMRAGGG